MTYKKFYTILRKLRGKYKLDTAGMIRALDKEATGYCPIVGVAKLMGGKMEDFPSAAHHIRLTNRQAMNIIEAADNHPCSRPVIRRALLKALGLKERTQ